MKTTMRMAAVATFAVAGMASTGCRSTMVQDATDHCVDPCWPERYSAVAREEVLAPFATQVSNGEIISQTIWNYHFETASDKLTPAGIESLDVIVKKRPSPNASVFVQTAHDISYDAAKADQFAADRAALDAKRIESIKKYLSVQAAAKGTNFTVLALDPSDPAFYARYPGNAIQQLPGQYRPTLNMGGGGGGGAGGATGSLSGGGGSGR
jgi:hypothetical protein